MYVYISLLLLYLKKNPSNAADLTGRISTYLSLKIYEFVRLIINLDMKWNFIRVTPTSVPIRLPVRDD